MCVYTNIESCEIYQLIKSSKYITNELYDFMIVSAMTMSATPQIQNIGYCVQISDPNLIYFYK